MPRRTSEGQVVLPGHVGTIYQAHNGVYLGRCKKRPLFLLPDGRQLNERTLSKMKAKARGEAEATKTKGWRSGRDQLVAAGAADPGETITLDWLSTSMAACVRKVDHLGNHKYAWPINRRMRKHLPDSKAYPKTLDPEQN
jgi:hypothetical protein